MHKLVMRLTIAVGAIVGAACVYDAPVTPTDDTVTSANTIAAARVSQGQQSKAYLINFTGTEVPDNLAAAVAAAGGTLTSSLDRIGVALVSSSDPTFAARAAQIRGVEGIDEDIQVQWVKPETFVEATEATDAVVAEPSATFGNAETFRRIQWAPDAVHAPEAWDLGQRGAGV